MEEQIRQGNMNPEIDSKQVGEGIIEFRGRNGGRILARERDGNVVEILGKTGKVKKDQNTVIKRVKEMFPNNEKK